MHSPTPLASIYHDFSSDVSLTTEDWAKAGRELFEGTYGDTTDSVQSLLDSIYPDLGKPRISLYNSQLVVNYLLSGYFSTTFAYGYTYSFSGVMSQAETSFAMVAALITVDTPRQITWHLNGAVRNGASVAEVQAVRKISIEVARAAGVKWKNEIPDI